MLGGKVPSWLLFSSIINARSLGITIVALLPGEKLFLDSLPWGEGTSDPLKDSIESFFSSEEGLPSEYLEADLECLSEEDMTA